jgi:hypothetical protein
MSLELTADLALAYFALLVMALVPIYLGSHLSLKQKGVIIKNQQIVGFSESKVYHLHNSFE